MMSFRPEGEMTGVITKRGCPNDEGQPLFVINSILIIDLSLNLQG